MLLLIQSALAVPFVGFTLQGSIPLTEDYVVPGASVGGYAGVTFPRMGFAVRATWGSGEGDFAYGLQTARIDGLHLFRPDDRIDPFVLYGGGYRSTRFPTTPDRVQAQRLGILDNPALVVFGEAGGGVIVRVVGPLHARIDTRVWVGIGMLGFQDRAFVGLDASLGLELRLGKRDRDRDGLLDRDDECPDDREDFDRLLDHDGCPDEDVDRDGIADVRDACPTRRETVNQHDDTDGCPDMAPAAVLALPAPLRAFTGTIDGIVFVLDSAEILPQSEPVLDAAAAVLREYPDVRVLVLGHTDAIADDAYNLALSRARAEAVVGWLGAHGVDPARLTADGLGETRPVDTNETEAGRARNRRVEFAIVSE
ncbi:MAG: OmpA family protein [Pseudomonadota bacterium]|nr:OmpA family protein [Pseudomonadota bacterium]